ncbi:Ger(x)C family spore germination protein [Pullulanibacillus sp. KACC 23026]|uniref:Ger(x)C family spore germination protein n=1 Tax=Pullulanibacillus sp. KACC 23026 TaxID=3028315 RepID=UPI0023B03617|nr:Ger(x)C family spore germination protein [Pullulanibacillus sp. KACC 23026]WEG12257.1 Ger(x)C family spore germination protein [Pullulanibacillus sp. KACC 23026]
MKKIIMLSMFLIVLLTTSGCWDYYRIENLAFVMAVGFDKAENGKTKSTYQIALPSALSLTGNGGDKQPILVLTAEGKDAVEAEAKIQSQLSRKLSFSHLSLVIFGEQFARQGIKANRDVLLRSPYSRINMFVVTSKGSTAQQVLQTPYPLERVPILGLKKMLNLEGNRILMFDEFLTLLSSSSHEQSAYSKAIRISNMSFPPGKIFDTDEIAVYRKEKLAGFLNSQQVIELSSLWGSISQKSKTYPFGTNETMGIEFLDSKSHVEIRVKEDRPHIKVNLNFNCQVIENNTSIKLADQKDLQKAQEKLDVLMKKNAELTMHILQKKMKSDIWGFGKMVHDQDPVLWKNIKKNWYSIYPEIPIEVDVKVNLLMQGRIQSTQR